MKELPKAYDPKQYEDGIYRREEASGFFGPEVRPPLAENLPKDSQDYFSIVLPPPNVTGTLHMGHAAMLAIEDVMVRYHRMKGDRTLWVPGTDHAAVATESKVEGLLIKNEGFTKPKQELGREAFMQRVHQFAQESHDTIVNQARRMGASLDWQREAFTLDEVRNRAVRMVFKKMYDDGLIYRGYRVINWSVKGQSTCSDDELVYVERPAKLYYFKYSKDFPITIATTRPETKLGDTAVAVNPKGKWKKYIGQEFTVPGFGGDPNHVLRLKIIGDDSVDDSFGTGALGVTPAHSPIDFEMYQKQKALGNDIGLIAVIGEDGRMTAAASAEYQGLKTEEARVKVVAWLEAQGLLEKTEDTVQNVGTSDRFSDVVEPLPKTQWFVDVNKKFTVHSSQLQGVSDRQEVTLKELMQTVVKSEQIKIIPDRFNKTYFHWIDNLRDWCISRQIWYGHQIPVYYCSSCHPRENGDPASVVSVEEIKTCPHCGGKVTQDPDTLDTWFSSGLWTFSTLLDKNFAQFNTLEDWVAASGDMKNFHPTSVLETGYDILFFWVARMILMTTYALGEVPFKTVYLHGLVRDEQGRKMSKTLGNIINPLDMIEKYGTDATRLSLLIGSTPGNDVKLSEEKVAGFRNFTNKLWNIARFMLLNIPEPKMDCAYPEAKTDSDESLLRKLNDTSFYVTKKLEEYEFSNAGDILREFTWNQLADWHLEAAKKEGNKSEVLNYTLNTLLKLWHPFMPLVTEAIWQTIYGENAFLMIEKWPLSPADFVPSPLVDLFLTGSDSFDRVRNLVNAIRVLRKNNNIDLSKTVDIILTNDEYKEIYLRNQEVIKGMPGCNVGEISFNNSSDNSLGEAGTSPEVLDSFGLKASQLDASKDYFLEYIEGNTALAVKKQGLVDAEKEKARLQKELDEVLPYVESLAKKLSNDEFVQYAPPAVVEKERLKLADAEQKISTLQSQLKQFV